MVEAWVRAMVRGGFTSLMEGEPGSDREKGGPCCCGTNWWFAAGDGFINIIFMRWNKSNTGA